MNMFRQHSYVCTCSGSRTVGPEFQCIHVHEDRGQNLTVHVQMAEAGGAVMLCTCSVFRQQKGGRQLCSVHVQPAEAAKITMSVHV